jgi:hypothetical protein
VIEVRSEGRVRRASGEEDVVPTRWSRHSFSKRCARNHRQEADVRLGERACGKASGVARRSRSPLMRKRPKPAASKVKVRRRPTPSRIKPAASIPRAPDVVVDATMIPKTRPRSSTGGRSCTTVACIGTTAPKKTPRMKSVASTAREGDEVRLAVDTSALVSFDRKPERLRTATIKQLLQLRGARLGQDQKPRLLAVARARVSDSHVSTTRLNVEPPFKFARPV